MSVALSHAQEQSKGWRITIRKFLVNGKRLGKKTNLGTLFHASAIMSWADKAKDGGMSGATVVGKKKSSRPVASLEVRAEPGSIWRLGKEEHGTAGGSYHYVVRRRLGSDVKAGRRLGSDGLEQFPLARMWTARVSSPHLDGQGRKFNRLRRSKIRHKQDPLLKMRKQGNEVAKPFAAAIAIGKFFFPGM
ncbi:hypothetical protein FNV43_RR04940 [Rhamnella rubrinervis]|uniref:Uncharacterized protein n=1 Tax=Rhamnella rubrinervis TaxID=2594499 RepID=A0A8K0MQS0_9ROSA|nr:hypothetical protein FNV43_RR04940 [Rhamnella rubrinervis]